MPAQWCRWSQVDGSSWCQKQARLQWWRAENSIPRWYLTAILYALMKSRQNCPRSEVSSGGLSFSWLTWLNVCFGGRTAVVLIGSLFEGWQVWSEVWRRSLRHSCLGPREDNYCNRSQDVAASREIRERGREMRQNVRQLHLPSFETWLPNNQHI